MRVREVVGRKRVALAVAALAIGGSTVVWNGTAQAAPTDGVCPATAICLWTNENYTGKRLYANFPAGSPNQGPLSGEFNNSVDSVINLTNHVVLLYDNNSASGDRISINPGERIPQLSARNFANKASYMVG